MPYFNIVAETNQNTVVTEYEPVRARADSYQSEAALEQEFIRLLGEQRDRGRFSVLTVLFQRSENRRNSVRREASPDASAVCGAAVICSWVPRC